MDKQVIQDVINVVTPELIYLILKIIIAGLVFYGFKGFVTSITSYLKLRNSLWGLNTKLLVDGKIGYIKNITFKEVIVEISHQETVYIPIDNFLRMNKTVYHNGYTGDKKE